MRYVNKLYIVFIFKKKKKKTTHVYGYEEVVFSDDTVVISIWKTKQDKIKRSTGTEALYHDLDTTVTFWYS